MIRKYPAFLLAGAAALALSACGKQSELERAAPMWGAKRAQYEAQKRAETEAKERENATHPGQASAPVMPARSAPIPGAKEDPSGSSPPGVLPDPYARPQ